LTLKRDIQIRIDIYLVFPKIRLKEGCWRKMKVRVHYLGFIKNLLKKGEEELELEEGALLSDLLNKIAGIYGEPFQKEVYESGLKDVKTGFVVTVNGFLMGQLHGVDTRLNEGDSVILMTLMSGG